MGKKLKVVDATREHPQPMRATQRVVAHVIRQIEQGKLPPGQRIPSTRTLAVQVGVSINTVQAALARLEEMGKISCRARSRAVVSERRAGKAKKRRGPVLIFAEPGAQYTDVSNSWGAQILIAAEYALSMRQLTTARVYAPTVDDVVPAQELEKIQAMLQDASGVIWLASPGLGPLMAHEMEAGVPVVTLNAPHDIIDHNLVQADNVGGGRIIGRVFAELGYRRCLLLTRGIRNRRFAPELAQGFLDSMMKRDIPLRGIEYLDIPAGQDGQAEAVVFKFLKQHRQPQGIFAVNDVLAIGAMRACQRHGLSVPRDVGIVSAVGLERCRQSSPTISAWTQPTRQMGEEAANMLLQLMTNPADRMPPVLVPSSLTLRQSLPHHGRLLDIAGVTLEPAQPIEAADGR